MFYVLTREYLDKSGFEVIGLTQNGDTALLWRLAAAENQVYHVSMNAWQKDGWERWEPR